MSPSPQPAQLMGACGTALLRLLCADSEERRCLLVPPTLPARRGHLTGFNNFGKVTSVPRVRRLRVLPTRVTWLKQLQEVIGETCLPCLVPASCFLVGTDPR